MRRIATAAVLAASTLPGLTAQEQTPPGHLYRGPLLATRLAKFIDPPNGALLEFADGWLDWSLRSPALETVARSRSVRSIPISGIVLRLAFGPTNDGMVTFRLRAQGNDVSAGLPDRITQNGGEQRLRFVIVREDRAPGVLALTPEMQVVYTVERIKNDENQLMFDNPDAAELLWDALGRPSLRAR